MMELENYKLVKKDIVEGISTNGLNKYEFSDNVNIAFGRVVIKRTQEGTPILYLDESCNKDYMKKWYKDVGYVLYKDIKKNNLDCYFELVSPIYKFIIRSISEDEIKDFENNENLVDKIIKVDNFVFLIIKYIEHSSSYSSKEVYNIEYEDYNEEDNEMEEIEELDDEELTSLSLFED